MRFEVLTGPMQLANVEQSFQHLFQRCFGHVLAKSEWRRLYLEPPCGNTMAIAGINEDSHLAAFYGLVPQKLGARDGSCIGYWLGVSLMIDPGQRGLAHFLGLIRLAHRAVQATNDPFLLGFPNRNSFTLLTRFCGWRPVLEADFRRFRLSAPGARPAVTAIDDLPDTKGRYYFPYSDPRYASWRRQKTDFLLVSIDHRLTVAAKRRGRSAEILDVGFFHPDDDAVSLLSSLTAALNVEELTIASHHVLELGLTEIPSEPSGDDPVRLAHAAFGGGEPFPMFRPSLLMSDVF